MGPRPGYGSDRAGVHVGVIMPCCPTPWGGGESGGGWGCCRIVEENEGWSVRGMIEKIALGYGRLLVLNSKCCL